VKEVNITDIHNTCKILNSKGRDVPVFNHRAMKTYGRVGLKLYTFLTLALNRYGHSHAKCPQFSLDRRVDWSQSQSRHDSEETN
jgi:hypothetical protein